MNLMENKPFLWVKDNKKIVLLILLLCVSFFLSYTIWTSELMQPIKSNLIISLWIVAFLLFKQGKKIRSTNENYF